MRVCGVCNAPSGSETGCPEHGVRYLVGPVGGPVPRQVFPAPLAPETAEEAHRRGRREVAAEIAAWLQTENAPGSACAHRVREKWCRS